MVTIRTYSNLKLLETFEERFEYLKLSGTVGLDTFGCDRIFNQQFYHSKEWKDIRNYIIARDNGCDLGMDGYELHEKIYIHHMNPLTLNDISEATENLLNPEYLICVGHNTHNAIHYGDKTLLMKTPIERTKFDTCPWRS